MKFSKNVGIIAYYVEKYLFPIFFAVMAAQSGYSIYKNDLWEKVCFLGGNDWGKVLVSSYNILSAILIIIYNILVGVFLVMAQKPKREPKGAQEILIPLVATFFYMAYSGLLWFSPAFALQNPIPASFQFPVLIGAVTVALGGLFLNLVSLYHLRHSFAIFVEVKEIIFSGPYKYIRHPMYTSHIMLAAGLVLSHFSLAILAVFLIHVGIISYRAHLEEEALASFDPKYKKYMEKTGFLVPLLQRLEPYQQQ
jgi:protein-S-isoprenylcysteine O-methyltransferase Ste14